MRSRAASRARLRWPAVASARALARVLALGVASPRRLRSTSSTLPAAAARLCRGARAAGSRREAWLYDRDGRLIDSARVDFAARRLAWVPLDGRRRRSLRDTLVAAEDRRFRAHGGVDWLALGGAAARRGCTGERGARRQHALDAGRRLPRARSRRARARAAGATSCARCAPARALEARWSKDQILEAYLNLAGFRGEAQGIGAAALGAVRQDARRADAATMRCCSPRCCPIRSAGAGAGRARAPARSARDTDCSALRRRGRVDARPGAQPRARSRPRAASRRPAADQAGRDASRPRSTRDIQRVGDRRAAPPAAGPRRRRARATARWSWSTMRAATCSPMSAGSAAPRPRRRSTARTPIARPDRR